MSSYFLLADSLGPGLAAVLSDAVAAGAATSLDTNWDPAEQWRDERLSAAIAQADLLRMDSLVLAAIPARPVFRKRAPIEVRKSCQHGFRT